MAKWSTLHEDDWVVTITADWCCGQTNDIFGFCLLEDRLKREGGKMVVLVDDDLAVFIKQLRLIFPSGQGLHGG